MAEKGGKNHRIRNKMRFYHYQAKQIRGFIHQSLSKHQENFKLKMKVSHLKLTQGDFHIS